jgi:hypothetical protein
MGASQSHRIPPPPSKSSFEINNKKSGDDSGQQQSLFPNPTGHEYDAIDKLQAELPSIIDEESQQQVDDYKEACNDGKGPVSVWIVVEKNEIELLDFQYILCIVTLVCRPS